MPIFNVLMIVILLASIALFALSFNRIMFYNRRYHLPESKYTKLFHVFTKEQIALLYLAAVVIHTTLTIWFIITL